MADPDPAAPQPESAGAFCERLVACNWIEPAFTYAMRDLIADRDRAVSAAALERAAEQFEKRLPPVAAEEDGTGLIIFHGDVERRMKRAYGKAIRAAARGARGAE